MASSDCLYIYLHGFGAGPRGSKYNFLSEYLKPAPLHALTWHAPSYAETTLSGAIGVVEFAEPVAVGRLCQVFAALGVWIRPMGKVVYLTPALTIGDDDLRLLTDAVCRGLA